MFITEDRKNVVITVSCDPTIRIQTFNDECFLYGELAEKVQVLLDLEEERAAKARPIVKAAS